MMILLGVKGLLASRKGSAFLLVLTISAIALFTGHLPGVYFAAVVGTICSTFFAAHSYQQSNTPSIPERGKL